MAQAKNKLSTAGVITIINKFKVHRKNQAFQCLMIYQDLDTEYCLIKPLLSKTDVEITMELYKIFATFGAPKEVLVNSCNQDMINSISENIKTLCPMFSVSFIRKVSDKNELAMKVVTELHKWTENNKKTEWEIGCIRVQLMINKEKDKVTNLSPYDRMFPNVAESNDQQKISYTIEYVVEDAPIQTIQTKPAVINKLENLRILPEANVPENNTPIVIKKEVKTEPEDDSLSNMPIGEIEVKMERLDEW